MNVHFQQSNRLARIETALGPDELALLRFQGEERVNTLFAFEVDALSARGDIDFDALIGTHLTAQVDHPDHGVQPFDGIVTQARYKGVGDNGYKYGFELRPWLWLAGKRRNQRIFHEMTVVEILQELFEPYADLSSPAYELRLALEYPKLEYTVQFAESDLDFACRMMERFGISYFFAHDTQSHTMVIVDQVSGFDEVPGMRRPFYTADQHRNIEIEHFWEWRPERNFTTGKIRLTDYNFKTPGAKMETFTRGDAKYAHGGIESYDWPGRYLELGRGEDAEIGLRIDQERGQDHRHFATGDCLTLRAGRRIELSGDQVHNATGTVFGCLAARHEYVSNQYGTGGSGEDSHGYTGDYILTPEDAPMVPRRKTPLARVHGPQTARVVGEGEIDCDEYGRILVRFHWDLHDSYSMRCRVSQNWAGNGWGGMIIPRIGMEVLVEFLDGDPDKPMVTGCVYNGRNKVPYDLPANKTRSTFKTDTHEGAGYNELRFEDKNGQEEIFIHAQKDRNEKTLNNHTERVDNNWVQSVGHNKAIQIGRSHDEVIGGNMSIHVGSLKSDSVVTSFMNRAKEGISKAARRLDLPIINSVGAGIYTLFTEKGIFETTMGMKNLFVGVANNSHAGQSQNISAGQMVQVTSERTINVEAGSGLGLHSGGETTIVCGKASIILNKDGDVRIFGRNLYMDFEGDVEINSEGKMSLDAPEVEQHADGGFKIKAARVDLN